MSEVSRRRRYQREVEALLEQIRDGVDDVRLRAAYGVRGAGLSELKQELGRRRRRLAELVEQSSRELLPGS